MVLYMQSNLCPARFLEYLRCLFILSCAVGQHFRSPITASALNKPSSSFSSSSSPFTVRVCVYVCVRVCVCVCVCVCVLRQSCAMGYGHAALQDIVVGERYRGSA